MNNEPKPTIIEDELIECSVCGSTDFCITRESFTHFTKVTCRQCNTYFGIIDRLTIKE